MRRIYKLFLFLFSSLIFLIIVFCVRMFFLFSLRNPQSTMSKLSSVWAMVMIWILDITVTIHEEIKDLKNTRFFIVSNHQSYLDIIIIASKFQTLFVAKKDVQSWPILGWLASLGGTLYIDRKAFRGAKNSIRSIEKALKNRICVNIFPEGTSSNGETIFPFKPALFNAAFAAQCIILPITLNYEAIDNLPVCKSNRDLVCWYGNMTFANHFWKVLRLDSIEVSILVHPVILPANFSNAKELSLAAFNAVNNGFKRVM